MAKNAGDFFVHCTFRRNNKSAEKNYDSNFSFAFIAL